MTSTTGPLSPHANFGDDVHFNVDHSSTVECSDRGTLVSRVELVRNEMLSALSFILQSKFLSMQVWSIVCVQFSATFLLI